MVTLPDGYCTATEWAQRQGVRRSTASDWCLAGLIPGAIKMAIPGASNAWVLPAHSPRPQMSKPGTRVPYCPLLPARPLIEFLHYRPEAVSVLARKLEMDRAILRRVATQERVTVDLADRILTRLGHRLDELWPQIDEYLGTKEAAA